MLTQENLYWTGKVDFKFVVDNKARVRLTNKCNLEKEWKQLLLEEN